LHDCLPAIYVVSHFVNKQQKKYAWAQEQRKAGKPTIPSTVAEVYSSLSLSDFMSCDRFSNDASQELKTNPFMRVKEEAVKRVVQLEDPIEVMAELRRRKDQF
jgi:hypothetical protein